LRDLGFGKKSLEGIITEEAEELLKRLQCNDIQVSTSAGSTQGICNVIISRLIHLQTPVGKLQCNNIQVNTAADLSSEIPVKGNCKCIW
jgi:hypothetical protein